MNNPNPDKNAPAAPARFQLSKSLTIRNKAQVRGPANPSVPPPQSQSEQAAQPPRAVSQDQKPKFMPNAKNARKKDKAAESNNNGMEEEIETGQKKKPVLSKNNLLLKPKEETTNKNNRGWAGQRISTSDTRAAFGGLKSGITNYEKAPKQKSDLFNTNLADEEIYKGRKFLFPVEVKIKTEKESVTNGDMLIETEAKTSAKELTHEKEITETLLNEFCFFQMPANLPLEGCYEMTPKTENSDMEINSNDLLSSFLDHKFDSTGFHLERDFKFLQNKSKDKMVEEKNPPKGKVDKGYDTYKIGKLCRMKNGELKMKIGNNFFDLTQGVQDSFYKELYAVDYSEQVAMSLFPIEKKFIIKPDMESFF